MAQNLSIVLFYTDGTFYESTLYIRHHVPAGRFRVPRVQAWEAFNAYPRSPVCRFLRDTTIEEKHTMKNMIDLTTDTEKKFTVHWLKRDGTLQSVVLKLSAPTQSFTHDCLCITQLFGTTGAEATAYVTPNGKTT